MIRSSAVGVSLPLLLAISAPVFAQGAFGDRNFEQEVKRVSDEVGKVRIGRSSAPSGERPERPWNSDSRWGKEESSVLGAPNTAGSHKDTYYKEVQSGVDRAKLEKRRARDEQAADDAMDKAREAYRRAHATWTDLYWNKFWKLNQTWSAAGFEFQETGKSMSKLVWGVDTALSSSGGKLLKELEQDLDALRKEINDFALLYGGMYEPWFPVKGSFDANDPSARRDQAEAYLERLHAIEQTINDAKARIDRAQGPLDKRSIDLLAKARALKELTAEAERKTQPWLVAQKKEIVKTVTGTDEWRNQVLKALQDRQPPPPEKRPSRLADLKPGDVVLLAPRGAKSQFTYWMGIFISGRVMEDNPAAHSLVYLGRDAAGKMLFFNHNRNRGTHVLNEKEFQDGFNGRDKFIARPQKIVNGRKLLKYAVEASTDAKSGFGLFGKNTVCSEQAAIAVALATDSDIIQKRLGPIDVHPSDFFDDDKIGKYFLVSPVDD